ncbi:MAG: AI-2E family transporter [Verrucomicrobiales bacterium]|nr:AI-2E family transporter [Verrucomicrobiales bacterium]
MSFPPPTEKQARIIWFALTALSVLLTVAIVAAVLIGFGRVVVVLSPVLWPLAVAAIIAFILDPVVGWLGRRGVPRLRAILLVFGGAAMLVLGIFGSVVPRVVFEARDLANRVNTEYRERASEKLEKWLANPPTPLLRFLPAGWFAGSNTNPPPATSVAMGGTEAGQSTPMGTGSVSTNQVAASGAGTSVMTDAEAPWWVKAIDPRALRTAGDWLAMVVPEVGKWVLGQVGRVASWVGVLAGLALIPIYAFYFLLEKQSIERQWTDYVPVSDSRLKDELVWLVQNINDALIVFFRGQVLVAICDGVLYTIGFAAIGLRYSLLLGLMATVLTVVPFLGAIVTCGSALVIALLQFGDWQHPLLVLGVFVVVQTVEGWVIQPKIIGDRVGLHPVTIIIALLVGTTLMGGILGGLLAIPATAVMRALMFRYVWRVSKKGMFG